jgi:hypothetical protein
VFEILGNQVNSGEYVAENADFFSRPIITVSDIKPQ